MNNRLFYGVIVVIVAVFAGSALIYKKPEPKVAAVPVKQHQSQGENHIPEGTRSNTSNSDLPSSGDHYAGYSAPAQWGVYVEEVQPEIFLHNLEHGGVVIAYRPDLPKNQIRQLQSMFAPPYSDKKFNPSKAIVTPRASNKYPIELAAWRVTADLKTFNAAQIKQFYFSNVSNKRAPEPFAGPTNRPINQAL